MVSIIIVNWNGKHFLKDCLDSIRNQTYRDYEVILVDNGSVDGSVQFVEASFPEVRVQKLPENQGFARAVNLGCQISQGEFIALLNNDAVADSQWLDELLKGVRSSKEIGFCSSKILQWLNKEKIDSAGDCYTRFGIALKRGWNRDKEEFIKRDLVFGASAAGALYRKSMLKEIGCLDEDFFCIYEDVDLSFRAQLAGYQCLYVPTALVYHRVGGTSGVNNDFTLYYGQRNLEFVFFKNMPFSLLIKYFPLHIGYILIAFIYHLLKGRGGIFVRSKMDALKDIRLILQKRRAIQKKKSISTVSLERIFDQKSLFKHIIQRI